MLLSQHLKPVIYMPDELVIKQGWQARAHATGAPTRPATRATLTRSPCLCAGSPGWQGVSMYFIQRGKARVVLNRGADDQRTLGHLETGNFFGEVPRRVTRPRRPLAASLLSSHAVDAPSRRQLPQPQRDYDQRYACPTL